jgi:hypothetical protein
MPFNIAVLGLGNCVAFCHNQWLVEGCLLRVDWLEIIEI